MKTKNKEKVLVETANELTLPSADVAKTPAKKRHNRRKSAGKKTATVNVEISVEAPQPDAPETKNVKQSKFVLFLKKLFFIK